MKTIILTLSTEELMFFRDVMAMGNEEVTQMCFLGLLMVKGIFVDMTKPLDYNIISRHEAMMTYHPAALENANYEQD